MNHDSYDHAYIHDILQSVNVIAMIGASDKPERPSNGVMKFLLSRGYVVIPVNPRLAGRKLHEQRAYGALSDISQTIDMIDVFRNSRAVEGVVEEAMALDPKPKVIRMQLGLRHDEAAARAQAAGIKVVMNRCPAIELGRHVRIW